MTEYLAAFVGSLVGVALGIVGAVHLWQRSEQRAATKRAEAKLRHPANRPVFVKSDVEFEATARKFRRPV